MNKWDKRFLDMAELVATWSKDPSTKVGAVIVKGRRFVSLGFNGLPQGVADTTERLDNRDLKYKMIVHGEINAMIFSPLENLEGCTLYTVPFMPCSVCAGQIIQHGIKEVVSYVNHNPRWQEDFRISEQMFKESGVELLLFPRDISFEVDE